MKLSKCISFTLYIFKCMFLIRLPASVHTLQYFLWVTVTYSPPSIRCLISLSCHVSAAQWSVRFPQSVFRRGPSMPAQWCLVYQHYWLQVMFWTESIWPLEGFKYIIVQRGTLWDLGYTDIYRHADKVANKKKQNEKKSPGHVDKHFLSIFSALQILKIRLEDR